MIKLKWTLPLLAVTLGLAVTGCNNNNTSNSDVADKSEGKTSFLDVASIDSAISPADNFWMYANGKWYNTATIPGSESGIGAFLDLRNKTRENLKSIFEDLTKGSYKAGSVEQKVKDFYLSGLDSATIEKLGYEPIKPVLNTIDGLKSNADIMPFVAKEQTNNMNFLFDLMIGSDEKNSTQYLPSFYQGGLGMPDRDYYFKTDAQSVETINAYKKYINTLFTLTGLSAEEAAKATETVFNVEKQLAQAHATNVELRNPESNYNKVSVAAFAKANPELQFDLVLKTMGINIDSVNIGQVKYFRALNAALKSVPLDAWKLYLKSHYIQASANELSKAFVDADFAYNGVVLEGLSQQKPRWQNIIAATNAMLGDGVSELYVKKYFTQASKDKMLELVNNLQKAFENRINNLDWMSDSTKVLAKEKLHTFIKKIGFPDKWKDYSSININPATYSANILACNQYLYKESIDRIGKPVDRSIWEMTASTVNAYYNPTFNEIVFPAGILQFPFFDLNADDAINYGGIGMVIGHEMSHGFDDQGAQYDKDGNLKNWWSPEDLKKFNERGKKLINLFNSFTVLDSLHVNGALTQGENIGDLGGIAIAYDAFKLTKQGQDTTKIDGFTPDQRFFMSMAQIWKGKKTDAALRTQIFTDAHSPAIYRVNGPLMNFEPFYKAFNVKEGDKMYLKPEDRVRIW
ncbi:M13 family metallopeptidase [Polluticaenibacter yanchengensis]|uniref:M13 family metallopeptidase n=1 Tax=Polluticaenibacter yanchengensis TaxID=3014562 RepID=A0ABT4UH34_9BACT|nr:M13 family metallopeptidase [Chitinophagaceae bacterium LY-5]